MENSRTAHRYRIGLDAGLATLVAFSRVLRDAAWQSRKARSQFEALRGLDARQREDVGLPPLPEIEYLILDARAKAIADMFRRSPFK